MLDPDDAKHRNRFPPSPLCVITFMFDGQVRRLDDAGNAGAILPPISFSGPQLNPVASQNEGPVHFLSFGIFPDAWKALTGLDVAPFENRTCALHEAVQGAPLDICDRFFSSGFSIQTLETFESELEALWSLARPSNRMLPHNLNDWMMTLTIRAAAAGRASGIRQLQRRVRAWTGLSQRSLGQFSRNEGLFERLVVAQREGDASLAKLATESGFADQAHMNRFVRKMHGQSPARLNELIETDESYWCYRLLRTRF